MSMTLFSPGRVPRDASFMRHRSQSAGAIWLDTRPSSSGLVNQGLSLASPSPRMGSDCQIGDKFTLLQIRRSSIFCRLAARNWS